MDSTDGVDQVLVIGNVCHLYTCFSPTPDQHQWLTSNLTYPLPTLDRQPVLFIILHDGSNLLYLHHHDQSRHPHHHGRSQSVLLPLWWIGNGGQQIEMDRSWGYGLWIDHDDKGTDWIDHNLMRTLMIDPIQVFMIDRSPSPPSCIVAPICTYHLLLPPNIWSVLLSIFPFLIMIDPHLICINMMMTDRYPYPSWSIIIIMVKI